MVVLCCQDSTWLGKGSLMDKRRMSQPRSQTQTCQLLASQVNSWCLSFLICKMGQTYTFTGLTEVIK